LSDTPGGNTSSGAGVSHTSEVSLREVTKETVRQIVNLRVAPSQEGFVASNGMSISEAHFEGDHAWFRAVYADEVPIGFTMLALDPEKAEYHLWRFMMDQRYQGFGFGKRALELVIDYVRTLPNAKQLLLSYVPGEGCPRPFYEKLGFIDTGVVEDGEIVMRLEL
jgi:diamine N-acetyltransferase